MLIGNSNSYASDQCSSDCSGGQDRKGRPRGVRIALGLSVRPAKPRKGKSSTSPTPTPSAPLSGSPHPTQSPRPIPFHIYCMSLAPPEHDGAPLFLIDTDTHTTRDMAVPSGEDATPEEAPFRNVPRRRRSAARPPEEEEELVGDDPARGAPSAPPAPTSSRDVDEGRAVAPSAACDKKRTASDRGGHETHVRRAEKRHRYRPLRAEDTKNDGGGTLGRQTFSGDGAPPAPPQGTADVAATAASASCSGERHADWVEKERIRKGKMPAAEPSAVVPGGGGKLMADAIRSHGACSKNKPPHPHRRKSKKRKDRGTPFWYGMGRDGQSTSAAGSDVDHSFFKMGAVVSDMLRATLASLGVDDAAPKRVFGRLLSNCDRSRHQSRLQMSCKRWRADRDEYPLCAFLTEKEKEDANGTGLTVKAYDRRGEKYDITIKFLGSNRSYRLTNKWGHFLEDNGLIVANGGGSEAKHVMLDLWLFRPPGGKLGMVMLHYFKGDAAHADAALEEEEDRRLRCRGNDDDATAAVAKDEASSPVEPDGGAGGKDDVTEDVAGCASGKVEDDGGGVKSEAVASAPSPSEEPDGGGAKAAAGEEQAGPLPAPDADGTNMEEEEAGGALVETAGAQLSSEASGAAKVEAGGAPGEADGTKTTDKLASAGTTEAAAGQPSVDKEGGVLDGEDVVQAPSPPVEGAGGAKKATLMFGLTYCDVSAAYTLMMLSQGHWA